MIFLMIRFFLQNIYIYLINKYIYNIIYIYIHDIYIYQSQCFSIPDALPGTSLDPCRWLRSPATVDPWAAPFSWAPLRGGVTPPRATWSEEIKGEMLGLCCFRMFYNNPSFIRHGLNDQHPMVDFFKLMNLCQSLWFMLIVQFMAKWLVKKKWWSYKLMVYVFFSTGIFLNN